MSKKLKSSDTFLPEVIEIMDLSPFSEAAQASFVRDSFGNSVYPYAPKPEQFSLEAIAHALSMQCRFNGHIDSFYSVAQHSVYVSRVCKLRAAKMWGLMHDAAEYIIGDIPTPVKRYLPKEVVTLEDRIADSICERFKVERSDGIDAEVKRADYHLLLAEAMTLHPDRHNELANWKEMKTDRPLRDYRLDKIDPLYYPWPPALAKLQFLNEFHALSRDQPSTFMSYFLS
jgi:hypothetical protein